MLFSFNVRHRSTRHWFRHRLPHLHGSVFPSVLLYRSYTSRFPAVANRTLRCGRLPLASPLASSSRDRSRVCSLMAPASDRESGTDKSHRTLYNELKYEGVTRAGATSKNSVHAKFAEYTSDTVRKGVQQCSERGFGRCSGTKTSRTVPFGCLLRPNFWCLRVFSDIILTGQPVEKTPSRSCLLPVRG